MQRMAMRCLFGNVDRSSCDVWRGNHPREQEAPITLSRERPLRGIRSAVRDLRTRAIHPLAQLLPRLEARRGLGRHGDCSARLGIAAGAAGSDGDVEGAEAADFHALAAHQGMADGFHDRLDRGVHIFGAQFGETGTQGTDQIGAVHGHLLHGPADII